MKPNFRLIACGHFLSDSEELTLEEQLDVLTEAYDKGDHYIIPNYELEGVLVWDRFDDYDLGDLMDQIEMMAKDLEDCYNQGLADAKVSTTVG